MNVIKQYYIDPYQKELTSKIVNIEDNKIYLDKTIFYPEGGGQPGDKGFINNIKVLDTQKSDNQIVHIVENVESLNIGDEVTLKLDWEYRYNFMKMHTAQHLISGLLFSEFNVDTVSVHQGDLNLTIEINKDDFSEDDCYKLEDIANKAIIKGSEVSYLEMDKEAAEKLNMRRSIKVEGLIRIVDLDNFDKIACGGLHVKNIQEIERIMYVGFEKIRKHYRLLFRVNNKVSLTYRKLDKIVKTLCTMHSATVETLVDCDKALLDKKLELEREIRQLKKNNSKYFIQNLINHRDSDIIGYDVSDIDLDFKDIEVDSDIVLFLYKIEDVNLKWYIYLGESFQKYDFKSIRENVLSIINAKGGGRSPSFQGRGESANIKECISSFIGYFNE